MDVNANRQLGCKLEARLLAALKALPEAENTSPEILAAVEALGAAVAWLLDDRLHPYSTTE